MEPDADFDRPEPPKPEARRAPRHAVVVPIHVRWKTPDGEIQQQGLLREVNVHGGLVQMPAYPEPGQILILTNPANQQAAQARAVALRHEINGAVLGMAVELMHPSQTFWGVTFELKKATAELREIEERLRAGGVDLRVLRDFRDAVDYVRKTAWVVYEWQERETLRRDTSTVLPLLTAERIRRVIQLHASILTDLTSRHAGPDTPGLRELMKSIADLQCSLSGLLDSAEPAS